jgi:hypothetical protein
MTPGADALTGGLTLLPFGDQAPGLVVDSSAIGPRLVLVEAPG